jgi:hypothetical protein
MPVWSKPPPRRGSSEHRSRPSSPTSSKPPDAVESDLQQRPQGAQQFDEVFVVHADERHAIRRRFAIFDPLILSKPRGCCMPTLPFGGWCRHDAAMNEPTENEIWVRFAAAALAGSIESDGYAVDHAAEAADELLMKWRERKEAGFPPPALPEWKKQR